MTEQQQEGVPTGPQSYAERRLLGIEKSIDLIAFWVRLQGTLFVIGVVILVVATVAGR